LARVSRSIKKDRNAAIRDAGSFGLELETAFDGWQLPASHSYSGKAPGSGPKEFEQSCRTEIQRILSLTLKRRWKRILTNPPDVMVVVRLRGIGLTGGPYVGPGGRSGQAFSGASVRGTIGLQPLGGPEGDDLPPMEKRFKGMVQPPSTMADYRAWGAPPFVAALGKAGLQDLIAGMLRAAN